MPPPKVPIPPKIYPPGKLPPLWPIPFLKAGATAAAKLAMAKAKAAGLNAENERARADLYSGNAPGEGRQELPPSDDADKPLPAHSKFAHAPAAVSSRRLRGREGEVGGNITSNGSEGGGGGVVMDTSAESRDGDEDQGDSIASDQAQDAAEDEDDDEKAQEQEARAAEEEEEREAREAEEDERRREEEEMKAEREQAESEREEEAERLKEQEESEASAEAQIEAAQERAAEKEQRERAREQEAAESQAKAEEDAALSTAKREADEAKRHQRVAAKLAAERAVEQAKAAFARQSPATPPALKTASPPPPSITPGSPTVTTQGQPPGTPLPGLQPGGVAEREASLPLPQPLVPSSDLGASARVAAERTKDIAGAAMTSLLRGIKGSQDQRAKPSGKPPWIYETSPAPSFPSHGDEMRESKVCSSMLALEGCAEAKRGTQYYDTHTVKPGYVASLTDPVGKESVCVGSDCPTAQVTAAYESARKRLDAETTSLASERRFVGDMQKMLSSYEAKIKQTQQQIKAHEARLKKTKVQVDKLHKTAAAQVKAAKKAKAAARLEGRLAASKQALGSLNAKFHRLSARMRDVSSVKKQISEHVSAIAAAVGKHDHK